MGWSQSWDIPSHKVRMLPKQPGLGLSLQAGPSGALFGGITIDIQTKEQTKRNKTTIYMKSGHMTGGCVKVRDRRDQEDVEFSKSAMSKGPQAPTLIKGQRRFQLWQ